MGRGNYDQGFHDNDGRRVYPNPHHISIRYPETITANNGQPFKSAALSKLYDKYQMKGAQPYPHRGQTHGPTKSKTISPLNIECIQQMSATPVLLEK